MHPHTTPFEREKGSSQWVWRTFAAEGILSMEIVFSTAYSISQFTHSSCYFKQKLWKEPIQLLSYFTGDSFTVLLLQSTDRVIIMIKEMKKSPDQFESSIINYQLSKQEMKQYVESFKYSMFNRITSIWIC